MTNKEKYNKAFTESLSIPEAQLGDGLVYNATPAWDSIGHMTLISAFEDTFQVSMETDDIISLSSYLKGFEILAKYGVKF